MPEQYGRVPNFTLHSNKLRSGQWLLFRLRHHKEKLRKNNNRLKENAKFKSDPHKFAERLFHPLKSGEPTFTKETANNYFKKHIAILIELTNTLPLKTSRQVLIHPYRLMSEHQHFVIYSRHYTRKGTALLLAPMVYHI